MGGKAEDNRQPSLRSSERSEFEVGLSSEKYIIDWRLSS